MSLFAALVITSCSKDDDNDKGGASDSLVGTQWVYEDNNGYTDTYAFTTATTGVYTYIEPGKESGSDSFTYTYKKPNITIVAPWGTEVGTVNGDKMTLAEEGYPDHTWVYIKK